MQSFLQRSSANGSKPTSCNLCYLHIITAHQYLFLTASEVVL